MLRVCNDARRKLALNNNQLSGGLPETIGNVTDFT